MSTTTPAGCDNCNRSGLSLLLLRPSPIAIAGFLVPPGSEALQTDQSGLVPGHALTESRYVLRLLRAGYVHVYIPNPPQGVKEWLVYRVTDNADLVEQGNPVFAQMPAPPACSNTAHNAAGMRLLHIPQAHKIPTVWMAYSANLWNEKLKKQNRANPEAMMQVDLAGGTTPGSFLPTASRLRSSVLECALNNLSLNKATDHDFQFNSLAPIVDSLADNLVRAAACHPLTAGKERAVVLPDPVGLTAELNALRLRRHEIARRAIEAEAAKPENEHALKSSEAMLGLKELQARVEYAKALEKLAPIVSFKEYSEPKPGNPFFGATIAPFRYEGRTWEEIEGEGRSAEANPLGRVWPTGGSDRVRLEADKALAKSWGDIADEYSETGRAQWVKDFHDRMKREHLDVVARFEADWWATRKSDSFKLYFEMHFDETDPNALLQTHSCGLVYAREVSISTTPAPLTTGKVLEAYVEELAGDPSQPSSVMVRALAANQKEILKKLQPIWAIEKAGVYAHESRNDKLFDLGVGLLRKLESSGLASKPRYSWLAPALGNLFGGYSLTVAQGLTGAVSALCASLGAAFLSTDRGRKLVARAQGLAMVQRTTDLVLKGFIDGDVLRVPLQITMHYPAGKGILMLFRDRGTHTYSQAAGLVRGGAIEITLLTDNLEMAKYGGNVADAIRDGAGRIDTPANPKPAIVMGSTAWRGMQLRGPDFDRLWLDGRMSSANAKAAALEMMQGKQAIITTLDGRLALGGLLLNGLGLIGSFGQINDEREEVRRAAWFGLVDGASGVLGGLAGVWEVALKARLTLQVGQGAVERSITVHSLRAAGHVLGAVAGLANAGMNWMRANDASEAEQKWVGRLYRASSWAFLGTTGTFGALAVGALADRMVAKGVARAVAIRIAARFGAQGVIAGSLSGWGTVLLGLAVLFEVGAVIMTPTEMEKWAKRTRFGNRFSGKFTNWAEEEAELNKLFSPPEKKTPAAPTIPTMIFPIFIPGSEPPPGPQMA
jgi:hypothetical protein